MSDPIVRMSDSIAIDGRCPFCGSAAIYVFGQKLVTHKVICLGFQKRETGWCSVAIYGATKEDALARWKAGSRP